MSAKDENMMFGLDRLSALFTWWGVPAATGNGSLDRQMKCCQAFASDLQKAYGDTCSRQMEAALAANDRISRSLQDFLRCRQPQDVIAAQSNVFATVLEEVSSQAKVWAELTQKVQDCCAAMARETAAELVTRPKEGAETKSPARPAQSPARDASRQPAHV